MFQIFQKPESVFFPNILSNFDLNFPMETSLSNQPQMEVDDKYRIKINCKEFSPKSIQTKIEDGNLIVVGKEGIKSDEGDFNVKEFKSTYKLPENVDTEKMITYFTGNNVLNIEIPYSVHGTSGTAGISGIEIVNQRVAKVIEDLYGNKCCIANFSIPNDIDVNKISVINKNRDIIAHTEDGKYFRRCTFPLNEDIDFEKLRCVHKNKLLEITAPIRQAETTKVQEKESTQPQETKSKKQQPKTSQPKKETTTEASITNEPKKEPRKTRSKKKKA